MRQKEFFQTIVVRQRFSNTLSQWFFSACWLSTCGALAPQWYHYITMLWTSLISVSLMSVEEIARKIFLWRRRFKKNINMKKDDKILGLQTQFMSSAYFRHAWQALMCSPALP